MAKKFQNSKGFEIVQVNLLEIRSWGGFGICDFCNEFTITQYFVAVLNQCLCKKCMDGFLDRQTPYPEDRWYEEQKMNWIQKYVTIE